MLRISSPAFGLMSGFAITMGLLPHIATLCFLLVLDIPPRSVTSLIMFTMAAKALGEWFFWDHCIKRMDSEQNLKNWRSVINKSLVSYPNVSIGLIMMLLDVSIDIILINVALVTSIPPVWIFISLLGCQAIASPIQGALSDMFSQKKSLLFATTAGTIAMSALLWISVGGDNGEIFIKSNTQMVIILCGKGLFANVSVIARAIIAKVVKLKTLEKFGEV